MDSPIKIQIAFQGGGAKLCDLLAAAEAIQQLEALNKLEVTRVAGTSAGAIVACAYATKQPLSTFVERLTNLGPKHLPKIGTPAFTIRNAVKVWRGNPMLDEGPLRELLADLFKDYPTLETLRLPPFIVAADLGKGETKTYPDGEILVNAVMDSCGLPFFFRAPNNMGLSNFVDGGLCEIFLQQHYN
jgi:predicted acylesterase/phospholipase RssA